ncbi:MAG: NAD(P)H-dependent oxidoreductase [Clostridiales Family XIII bacterium]|jgi:chromate reductase|nr:NAD(P)H-dependent oxidoreductase [Clostridiales Family XIII bacterium]
MAQKKIGIVVGSLRKESYSRKIAYYLLKLLSGNYDVNVLEIGDLGLFNQDYDDEGTTPESWIVFRKNVAEQDAILFVTPEYNRSFPGVIKNAIDIASRPAGENVWTGKPGAIVSVSPSRLGGFGSNHHLSQPVSFLGIYLMPQPEEYIADVATILDENGEITSDYIKGSLKKFADAFTDWIDRF